MQEIFSLVLSVAANVISHYICKWLDGWLKGRKHKKEDPLLELQLRKGVFFCFRETRCTIFSRTFIICALSEKSSHI